MCVSEGHGWKGVSYCTKLYCSRFIIASYSIGKGAGYKRSELSALCDGSTLVVGGKELEVHVQVCASTLYSSNS